jgi:hypothetical protein
LGLIGLVGLFRIAWLHTGAEGASGLFTRASSIDERLPGLRALLPGRGRLGYLGEAFPGDKRPYYRTAYGVAPWILVPGRRDLPCTIAEVSDPAQVTSLASSLQLVIVTEAPGIALLCREGGR